MMMETLIERHPLKSIKGTVFNLNPSFVLWTVQKDFPIQLVTAISSTIS